jgi:hypothetical protein
MFLVADGISSSLLSTASDRRIFLIFGQADENIEHFGAKSILNYKQD